MPQTIKQLVIIGRRFALNKPLLEVKNLSKHYPIYGGLLMRQVATVFAVTDISFVIQAGETLGLVGESGCGKSTLGRTLLKLYPVTDGKIFFRGEDITNWPEKNLHQIRKEIQIIFQDPYESLNSRHTVGYILEEPFIIHNIGTPQQRSIWVNDLLQRIGLPEGSQSKYPHEFSGGQRQRIGIARAIALKPSLIVCDEPVSALDVSMQSQILNLLMDLQKEMHLSYIFISHDLATVKHISDRLAVMYLGGIVEIAKSNEIYEKPLHPYTQSLLSAIPIPDPTKKLQRKPLKGEVPSPRKPPSGCAFHTRCPYAKDICKSQKPKLEHQNINGANKLHLTACHFPSLIKDRK